MKKFIVILFLLFICTSYSFAENYLLIYTNDGKIFNANLNEITDSSFVLLKSINKKDSLSEEEFDEGYEDEYEEEFDTLNILKNDISKVIVPESSSELSAEIEIHFQDSIIENVTIKGVDLDNNLLYFAHYDYFKDEIISIDTLNLADTNITIIVVFGESNVIGNLFAGTGIGLVGGAIVGGLLGSTTSDGLAILIGIAGGGVVGGVLGLVAGTAVGVISSSSDMIIDNTNMLKYELLNYIIYPKVIYEPDELE